ncbi:MAG: hypothetical protein CM15mP69_6190 [Ectothiorhodospiraceae bacterium]|nr:MAG: hypothetical protein CM15mP69_6190 [Ectothiorhodospiraceae bacterium]
MSTCFDMRFIKTASHAQKHGFDIISSTLGISRWKDFNQINNSGIKAEISLIRFHTGHTTGENKMVQKICW